MTWSWIWVCWNLNLQNITIIKLLYRKKKSAQNWVNKLWWIGKHILGHSTKEQWCSWKWPLVNYIYDEFHDRHDTCPTNFMVWVNCTTLTLTSCTEMLHKCLIRQSRGLLNLLTFSSQYIVPSTSLFYIMAMHYLSLIIITIIPCCCNR